MKSRITKYALPVAAAFAFGLAGRQSNAQSGAFTYQGRLSASGSPANGTFDLTFSLFDAGDGGDPISGPQTNSAIPVVNGLFSTTLDFGTNFPGADRWLELGVRTNGGTTFAKLSPRQKITSAPYAVTALNVAGTLSAGQVTGTLSDAQLPGNIARLDSNSVFTGAVSLTNTANVLSGYFSGNAAGLTNLPVLTLSGSATNITFYELVTTNSESTNTLYVAGAGTPQANGTYYAFAIQSGVTIWSNANGGGFWLARDPTTAFFNYEYQIVNAISGSPDAWPILYYADRLGGPWSNEEWATGISPPPTRVGFGTYTRPFVAVGQPIFDGGNLTNLNGAYLQTGSVSANSFANGAFNGIEGIVSVTGDVSMTGNVKATNIYGNISGATGLPTQGGEIWRNMPTPPIMFTTWWIEGPTPHESFCTNLIQIMNAKGIMARFQANGIKPYLEVDSNWRATSRDSTGKLWWNTNLFPHGMPWLADYCHTNGWLLELHQYFSDADHPTPDGGVFGPITTAETVNLDAQQFYSWGVDCWRAADGNGNNFASYQNQFARVLADAVLYPGNLPATYAGRTGMAIDMATHDVFSASLAYQVNNRWTDQGVCLGPALTRFLCEARLTQNGSGVAGAYTPTAWMSGKGHYISYVGWTDAADSQSLSDQRAETAIQCIFPGQMQFGGVTNWTAGFQEVFTNDAMLKIFQDPLCLPGASLYDDGTISAWARPLANGNFAIALVNESGSSSNMVLNWNQVVNPPDWAPVGCPLAGWRIPSNVPCVVDSVWGQTNLGTFIGGFTFPVAAHSLEFFKLTPQLFSASAFASGNVSAAQATSGSVIQTVWVTPFTGTTNGTSGEWSNVLSGVITPKLGTSRIIVQVSTLVAATAGSSVFARIARASSAVVAGAATGARTSTELHCKFFDSSQTSPMTLLASELAGSTSPLQYDFQLQTDSGGTWYVNRDATDDDAAAHPRAVTTMLIQEIAP